MKCEVAVAGCWRDVKSEVRRRWALTAEGRCDASRTFLHIKTGSDARGRECLGSHTGDLGKIVY